MRLLCSDSKVSGREALQDLTSAETRSSTHGDAWLWLPLFDRILSRPHALLRRKLGPCRPVCFSGSFEGTKKPGASSSCSVCFGGGSPSIVQIFTARSRLLTLKVLMSLCRVNVLTSTNVQRFLRCVALKQWYWQTLSKLHLGFWQLRRARCVRVETFCWVSLGLAAFLDG